MTWKTIKSSNKEIRYHIADEQGKTDYVDRILIKEDNNLIEIKYEILNGQPYDTLTVNSNKASFVVYLEKNANSEDPMFTYSSFFKNSDIEEIIKDIKSYILDIISYILNIS